MPRGKPTKRSERTKAVQHADRYFSLYIRARDQYCVICGSPDNGTCGHLFSRTHFATRWDPTNAYRQCAGCNLRHEHDPGPFTLYFLNRFCQEAYEDLHQQYSQTVRFSTQQIREIGDHYKRKYEELSDCAESA
jgi:5-methylcytosine-specific restriction endonuclease McrA